MATYTNQYVHAAVSAWNLHHESADGIAAKAEDEHRLVAPVTEHPSSISDGCERIGTGLISDS